MNDNLRAYTVELVRALTELCGSDNAGTFADYVNDVRICAYCGECATWSDNPMWPDNSIVTHDANCPITKARELLS